MQQRFKKGDRVRVTHREGNHAVPVGTVAVVDRLFNGGVPVRTHSQRETPIDCYWYILGGLSGSSDVPETCLELVPAEEPKKDEERKPKFKKGDKVRVTNTRSNPGEARAGDVREIASLAHGYRPFRMTHTAIREEMSTIWYCLGYSKIVPEEDIEPAPAEEVKPEPTAEPKFSPGQKVRVVSGTVGHRQKIGSVQTVTRYESRGDGVRFAYWTAESGYMILHERNLEPADAIVFQPGDKVKVLDDYGGHQQPVGAVQTVKEDDGIWVTTEESKALVLRKKQLDLVSRAGTEKKEEPAAPATKYKVGDRVRVVGNTCAHGRPIGKEFVIRAVAVDSNGARYYEREDWEKVWSSTYYVRDGCVEPAPEKKEEPKAEPVPVLEPKLLPGHLVEVTHREGDHRIPVGTVALVFEKSEHLVHTTLDRRSPIRCHWYRLEGQGHIGRVPETCLKRLPRYKPGDRVRVTGDRFGHGNAVGAEGKARFASLGYSGEAVRACKYPASGDHQDIWYDVDGMTAYIPEAELEPAPAATEAPAKKEDKPVSGEAKFKVGQKVKVVADNCYHNQPIGAVQTVTVVEPDTALRGCYRYRTKESTDGKHYYLKEVDLEAVPEETPKARFKAGDRVRVVNNRCNPSSMKVGDVCLVTSEPYRLGGGKPYKIDHSRAGQEIESFWYGLKGQPYIVPDEDLEPAPAEEPKKEPTPAEEGTVSAYKVGDRVKILDTSITKGGVGEITEVHPSPTSYGPAYYNVRADNGASLTPFGVWHAHLELVSVAEEKKEPARAPAAGESRWRKEDFAAGDRVRTVKDVTLFDDSVVPAGTEFTVEYVQKDLPDSEYAGVYYVVESHGAFNDYELELVEKGRGFVAPNRFADVKSRVVQLNVEIEHLRERWRFMEAYGLEDYGTRAAALTRILQDKGDGKSTLAEAVKEILGLFNGKGA
jgi:transcription antitermination factor NusG